MHYLETEIPLPCPFCWEMLFPPIIFHFIQFDLCFHISIMFMFSCGKVENFPFHFHRMIHHFSAIISFSVHSCFLWSPLLSLVLIYRFYVVFRLFLAVIMLHLLVTFLSSDYSWGPLGSFWKHNILKINLLASRLIKSLPVPLGTLVRKRVRLKLASTITVLLHHLRVC
jgi:hypothetical protein